MPFKKKEKKPEELDINNLSSEELEKVLVKKREDEEQKKQQETAQEESEQEQGETEISKSNARLIFQKFARLLQDKELQIKKNRVEERNPETKEKKTLNEVRADAEEIKITLALLRDDVGFTDKEVGVMINDVRDKKYGYLIEE